MILKIRIQNKTKKTRSTHHRFNRYYSIGGGFYVDERGLSEDNALAQKFPPPRPPHVFDSSAELMSECTRL